MKKKAATGTKAITASKNARGAAPGRTGRAIDSAHQKEKGRGSDDGRRVRHPAAQQTRRGAQRGDERAQRRELDLADWVQSDRGGERGAAVLSAQRAVQLALQRPIGRADRHQMRAEKEGHGRDRRVPRRAQRSVPALSRRGQKEGGDEAHGDAAAEGGARGAVGRGEREAPVRGAEEAQTRTARGDETEGGAEARKGGQRGEEGEEHGDAAAEGGARGAAG